MSHTFLLPAIEPAHLDISQLAWEDQIQQLAAAKQIDPKAAMALLASELGLLAANLDELQDFQADLQIASYIEYERRQALLGYRATTEPGKARVLILITAHPYRLSTQQWLETLVVSLNPVGLQRVQVTESDFQVLLGSAQQNLRAMDTLDNADELLASDETSVALELSLARIDATSNPVVKLVDSTLYDALRLGASDIHFEVQQRTMHIKYRLDGVLQSIRVVESQDSALQVISRIKVLADLDIAERRVPQDGRFRVLLERREIDFRVSIMPNISSEDAVLRILDRKHLTGQFDLLTLDALSFEEQVKVFIRQASKLPYGLLLVTGPTGSGKTTTLYAAISEINTGLDKIVTIEDPIEYQLRGVLQIPVNEKKGLTFAKGLRSILRHDPDKIMVGEIRDSETAQIAVQAALTGHQVFTTVHANNVFDVIGRFSNMGVDVYSLVAALSGIMAQRLVRKLCPRCATNALATAEEWGSLKESLPELESSPIMLKQRCGCEHCRGTGYKGRIAIAEILHIDDQIKDLLVQKAPISILKNMARSKGFLSLRDSAMAMVARGLTSMDEANRTTPIQ
jgi:general secretion pathway protein E